MPDPKNNQAEYPQHSNQKPGCGFPIIKLVVMFSLSTAAVIGLRIAALNTGEVTLARSLYETLDPHDVVLADRAYGTYADLALVQQKRADGVFRKHQSRSYQNHIRVRQQPLFQKLLSLTAESKVPLRPGRSEPRKRKRRPKAFPLMIKPRSVLKQELGAA